MIQHNQATLSLINNANTSCYCPATYTPKNSNCGHNHNFHSIQETKGLCRGGGLMGVRLHKDPELHKVGKNFACVRVNTRALSSYKWHRHLIQQLLIVYTPPQKN